MIEHDSFKENWSLLVPKIRDRWPALTDSDISEIDGDLDRLAQKVSARYALTRSELLEELTTLLQPARRGDEDVPAGEPRLGGSAHPDVRIRHGR